MHIFGSCLWKLTQSVQHPELGIVYNPEDFGGAGGELFVLAMAGSWLLTFIFQHDFLQANPIIDRVGYNNLCVGWDVPPAKYIAAPVFSVIIYMYIRYQQMRFFRAQLDPTMSEGQHRAVLCAAIANAIGWVGSIGIFVIDPKDWCLGHTLSFVQLVVFCYVGYFFTFVETHNRTHPAGAWIFLAVFGVVSVAFGACAVTQMLTYQETLGEDGVLIKTRGPIPPWVMMALDYTYFLCMGLHGNFLPVAPCVATTFTLASDDDFNVEREGVAPAGSAADVEQAPLAGAQAGARVVPP